MKRKFVDHPHYAKPTSQKPQKGPEPHGFHGVPGSTSTKARGKKILVGEQREDLMPDPDRKIAKFPREWPTEMPSPPKATKAKKAVKPRKRKKKNAENFVSVNNVWSLIRSVSMLSRSLYTSLDERTNGSLESLRGVVAPPLQFVYDLSNAAVQMALQNVLSRMNKPTSRL